MAIDNTSSITPGLMTNQYDPVSQSIASGRRINSAADNPSGQAIETLLSTQITTQDAAVRNANDGISLLQTANAGAQGIQDTLLRLNELAIQAQNGTLNNQQRQILDQEFQQGLTSINSIANQTQFNNLNLLNADNSQVDIALGQDANNSLGLPDLTADNLGLTGLNIGQADQAVLALQGLETASESLLSAQSEFGAQQNGLNSSINRLNQQSDSALSARSQISDTDYARALSSQVQQDILSQSALLMQSHSNQSREQTLQLLIG